MIKITEEEIKKEITRRSKITGAMGGKTTLRRYGKKHFSKLANKRWWLEEMKNKKNK